MSIDYKSQNGIAVITINRPDKLNSLTLQMFHSLGEAYNTAQADPKVGVVILTGAGEKAFCVGADLTESIPYVCDGVHMLDVWDAAHLKHNPLYKPLIGAVNGLCFGGGLEILLCSDIRVASSKAFFAFPEVSKGFVPGSGSLARLVRQIPYAWAMELMLTSKKIDAETALRYGILNYIEEPEKVFDKAISIAEGILRLSPNGVQTAKEAAIKLMSLPLEQAYYTEALLSQKAFSSPDAREGLQSFYEKREPNFPSKKW